MIMRTNPLITLVLIALSTLFTSCATFHSNQKLIVGKWKPVKVEKMLLDDKKQAGTTPSAGTTTPVSNDTAMRAKMDAKGGGTGSGDAMAKSPDKISMLYLSEQKVTLEFAANKTAVKDYRGKTIKATWKMKLTGKKIVLTDMKTNEKLVLEIVELTETQAVIIEKLPFASVKVTYAREK
jgi:hypothetical protein